MKKKKEIPESSDDYISDYVKDVIELSGEAIKLASSDNEAKDAFKRRCTAILIGALLGTAIAVHNNKKDLVKRVNTLEEEVSLLKEKMGRKEAHYDEQKEKNF